MKLVVVALGGNALLERGQPATVEVQERNAMRAAQALAPLADVCHLVITHGNGPQVGILALRAEALDPDSPVPLDVLGAESEGLIGYLLVRGLRSFLPAHPMAALLTQVVVDPEHPAFDRPTKPIGPVMEPDVARRRAEARGWSLVEDGDGLRRVVASPPPRGILELETLRILVERGVVCVCAGGGGVPVCIEADGRVHGVEAVVDKDHTASLLARELQADELVLLTDVEGIMEDFGGPNQRVIRELTPSAARALDLPAGSMAPKAEACAAFVEATGHRAAIGKLADAAAVVEGRAGTRIVAEESP